MTTTDDRVIVIGSGLGGLAAACTLGARGHRVLLLERNTWLGGKAAVLERDGFRFDMGPTILTLPQVLARIFSEAGRELADHLDLVRLDPQWRCFFDDGSVLDLRESVPDMQAELRRFAGTNGGASGTDLGDRYARFIDYSQRLHRLSEQFFFWKPIDSIGDMISVRQSVTMTTLKDMLAMRMGYSVASTIRKHMPDERVAQLLDHFTQYVGSSPYGSPAILCGIAHMQTDGGVWYPMGGTRAVVEALVELAGSLGVQTRTGVRAQRIATEGGAVSGVELDTGETLRASALVSNMDSVRTYRELIGGDAERRFSRRRRYEPACSGVVLYLGLDRAYEHLAHHDFVFSRDPEEEFDAIYRRGEPAPDPTAYLAAPARTDPTVAPVGGEALYVLVHTPYLRDRHDWSTSGPLYRSYRQTIIDKLKRTGGMEDLEQRIVFEHALTPADIHERYQVLNGAIYGLASHGKFLGAFKPGNRSRDVRGLYLAGGAAHPGPGMPMVMMSGWIAADALHQDAAHASAEKAGAAS